MKQGSPGDCVLVNFLDRGPLFVLCSRHRRMKGVVKAPDGRRPHPPRMSEREGISLERQGRDTPKGMKGWRPTAGLARRRIGLGEAGEFLPHIGSIGLSFPQGPRSRAHGPGDAAVDYGLPFRARQAPRPPGRTETASKRPR